MVNLYDLIRPTVDLSDLRARLKKYTRSIPGDDCMVLRKIHRGDNAFYLRKTEAKRQSNNIYFRSEGLYVSTRRLSYLLEHGEIPEGKYVKNTCGIFGCVAPQHLELADNVNGT
jgi:hypothetical protein